MNWLHDFDRHVSVYRVINHAADVLKNDETHLINFVALWVWGVNPVFSDGGIR